MFNFTFANKLTIEPAKLKLKTQLGVKITRSPGPPGTRTLSVRVIISSTKFRARQRTLYTRHENYMFMFGRLEI